METPRDLDEAGLGFCGGWILGVIERDGIKYVRILVLEVDDDERGYTIADGFDSYLCVCV